nr:putative ribonuclease H-like domain-containing protein [Tanacetum cinerariifolium]
MAQPTARNHAHRGTHTQYAQMTLLNPQRNVVPAAVLTQSKLVHITAVRLVSTVVHKISVAIPRQAKHVVTKSKSPPRRHINHSRSLQANNSPPRVTAVKAQLVNAAKGMQGKWEWRPKCLILDHVSHNTSASMTQKRFDYNDALGRSKSGTCPIYLILRSSMVDKLPLEVIQRVMCDKKNSVLFTDTECLILSPEFKLPDENQVLLRVPRENNMYNVNLKNIVPSEDLTCLFAKATLDESNLWHRRLGHINFKTMNRLVKENKPNVASSGPTWLFNIDTLTKTMNYQPVTAGNQTNPSAGFQEQYGAEKAGEEIEQQYEPEFEAKKPESEVIVSPSSSAQLKNHDDKTKKEAKGKSPVESLTGYRNLSVEFEDFSDNSINEVNTAGTLVPTVGQFSPNSINTFSAVGPLNAAASPTHRKSSCIDASQYPDDLDMPELEDITYSDDDDDDVGAEADFNNLETSITVSPIPTTRVHKDHTVTQIIGDLSSATQTRSMTRVAKDQGGLSQINNEDFHTCMFAYFLSQEEPKRAHQALKDLSWIEAMYEELLQFKMQKVWVLVDLPNGKRAIVTKWVFRNKKDERGIVVRNKARLVAQGYTQEEGIDYEQVFAPVARIEAIRLFLAYTSFMGFLVYQMDVKSAFLYGTIEKSTTRGCQFLRCRLISWQCKKQTVVATSSTEAEYVAAASCCVQVLWIQNQLLDYGMESLKRMVHVTNILSAGYLTTPQMVLNSPCLTHIKNWLVQIKRSLFWTTVAIKKVNDVTRLQTLVDKKKLMIKKQVGDISTHTTKYTSPALTQKVAEGDDDEVHGEDEVHDRGAPAAEGAAEGDVSVADDVVPTAAEEPSIPSPTPPTPPPQPSRDIPSTSQDAGIHMDLLQTLLDTCTTLIRRVEHLELDKVSQVMEITKLKQRVKKSDRRNKGRMIAKMDVDVDVVIEEDKDVAANIELNRNIDWDEAIDHVNRKAKEDPAMKRYQALKRKPHIESQARKNMIVYLKNVVGFKMDYFKGMSYDDIRPIFEAKFNTNVAFLQKTKEQIEEEESRALKRINETPADRAAKRQKVLFVDYEINNEHNKPYYKIKHADGSHQLYLSFLSMMRNFDREDLEALWRLVKERFAIAKPKNFFDDFLLTTLGAMFEKLDIHAQILKNQRSVHGQAKVKSWKLLQSCGVQIITFTTTQLILLVERNYPLTKFTLNQMINNVRLEVEEESEVSLEFLRFIRQQHLKGTQIE